MAQWPSSWLNIGCWLFSLQWYLHYYCSEAKRTALVSKPWSPSLSVLFVALPRDSVACSPPPALMDELPKLPQMVARPPPSLPLTTAVRSWAWRSVG